MTVTETMLLSAITALVGTVGILWRALATARASADKDRREASRLIFALLGVRAVAVGERPPPTKSTPEEPRFTEAAQLATKALNGDIESLVYDYLSSDPPPRGGEG